MANIAVARAETIWIATQASQGQDFTNFHVTHGVYHVGAFTFEQSITTFPNEEKRSSRTRLPQIKERYGAGTYNFQVYAKPSGTTLTKPELDAVLRAGVGSSQTTANTVVSTSAAATKTASLITVTNLSFGTTAGYNNTGILVKKGTTDNHELTFITSQASSAVVAAKGLIRISPELGTAPTTGVTIIGSVTYKPAVTSPAACAIMVKKDHTAFRFTGAHIGNITANKPGEGPATIDVSGELMRHYWTGTDSLGQSMVGPSTSTSSANATGITVGGSIHRFTKGSFAVISTTAATPASEVIYFGTEPATTATVFTSGIKRAQKGTSATNWATSASITPWVPGALATSLTSSQGTPQGGFAGVVQLDGTDFVARDVSVSLDTGAKMATGEINNAMFLQSFSHPGFRDVAVEMTTFYRQKDAERFRDAFDQVSKQVLVPFGRPQDGEGQQMLIVTRYVKFGSPTLSGEEEIEAAISGSATGTASGDNDEIYWIYL